MRDYRPRKPDRTTKRRAIVPGKRRKNRPAARAPHHKTGKRPVVREADCSHSLHETDIGEHAGISGSDEGRGREVFEVTHDLFGATGRTGASRVPGATGTGAPRSPEEARKSGSGERREPLSEPSRASVFLLFLYAAALLYAGKNLERLMLRGEGSWAEGMPRAALGLLVEISSLTGLRNVRDRADRLAIALKKPNMMLRKPAIKRPRKKTARKTGKRKKATERLAQSTRPTAAGRISPDRVLIIGASCIQLHLGPALERHLEKRYGIRVLRKGRVSTGLNWPWRFNWYRETRRLLRYFRPDLVLVHFGGNDGVTIKKRGQGRIRFGTRAWDRIYMKNIRRLLRIIRAQGARAVFLGMPVMRGKRLTWKMSRINSVFRRASAKYNFHFIETWDIAADRNGAYRHYIRVRGRKRALRMKDGIHYTRAGARYMAARIVSRVSSRFHFRRKSRASRER